jgi:hypothetical protein
MRRKPPSHATYRKELKAHLFLPARLGHQYAQFDCDSRVLLGADEQLPSESYSNFGSQSTISNDGVLGSG